MSSGGLAADGQQGRGAEAVGSPASAPADTTLADGGDNHPAAAASGEERPASASCGDEDEAGSETGSETDFRAAATAGAAAAPPPLELSQDQLRQQLHQSPFIDLQHPVTLYEGVKLAVMAPLVLLKLAALAMAVPYAWAVLALLLLGHKPQTPMWPFRQFLVRQWVHQWGRFLLFLSGFYHIPVKGRRNLKAAEECRAVLVFNHPSYVDAAVMATFFQPSGVSKAGVVQIPFIGLFGIALQLFFVERKGSGDRSNRHVLRGDAVAAIAQRAADRRFPLLAIAPEATTKAQPCLLKFRRGAFVTGQPVCPVLLKYSYRHFNPGWGICFAPFHVYRLLAQFVNHLEIEVLPPYHPSEEELQDWGRYAENVRLLMAARLGVPLGLAEERQLWRMGVRVNLLGTRAMVPPKQKAAKSD